MGRGVGGGGHSSGGSHSHRSGSHGSSHSHSSSRSYRSSRSNYSSNRSYSGDTHHYHHYSGGGYDGPGRYGPPVRYSIIKDVIAWTFTIILVLVLISYIKPGNSSTIPASTTQRERVETKNAYINDCVIDEIGWINNKTKLASRLKEFYKVTGCQPYIILRAYDSTMGTAVAREAWSKDYYDTHFKENQNVVLYTYFCDKNDEGYGNDTLFVGSESSIVMDSEAQEIFWAYLDYDWNTWDANDNDGLFVDVFVKTGERIMTVTTTANDVKKTVAIVIGAVIALVLVVIIISKKYRREKEKAQETIDILNAPLDTTSPTDDLINKYNQ